MATLGLALGGGGARGLAHIHVLEALDDLGVKPAQIAGSSIGAIVGAAYATGLSGRDIGAYVLDVFSDRRLLATRLWRTRSSTLAEFLADGGIRIGQLNVERLLKAFLPETLPSSFEDLAIPLTVMATDFYAHRALAIGSGDLFSALGASSALPAVFRPVRREGTLLIDGGVYDPVPFEHLADKVDLVVAVDVVGGPEGDVGRVPTPREAIFGASQLMMQSIIETKLKVRSPDLLIRPPVSRYKVLDFLRAAEILRETAGMRDEVKRAVDSLMRRPEPTEHPQSLPLEAL